MNILHLIDSMDFSRGGPPQVCANLVRQQTKTHTVSLASYTSPSVYQDDLSAQSFHGIHLGQLGLIERYFGLRSKAQVNEAVIQSDVLHIHNVWEPLLLSGATSAIDLDRPYVVTPHGMLDPWSMNQKHWKKKLALRLGRKKMLERAKFIHVLNEEEEAGIRLLGLKNRCEIVPNGVDLGQIDQHLNRQAAFEKFPELAERPFILFLARLHYKKGLDILAEATKLFFQSHPDWQLVVAGPDGGMEASFKQQIKEYGLERHAHVIGPVYGSLKFSLLSACEIFCLPSRQEGFSVAVLEAMAASRPVVISDHCHFREVADTESGLVNALDPVAISTSFKQLAESASLRRSMGENARELIERKYTWQTVNRRLTELYVS